MDEKGQKAFKVKGGSFSKHGIRIWPEALQAAGFDPAAFQPGQYSLAGYTAVYTPGDGAGKGQKVTELKR